MEGLSGSSLKGPFFHVAGTTQQVERGNMKPRPQSYTSYNLFCVVGDS